MTPAVAIGLDAGARIAVRAPNWLGDAVMALPALGALRAALPSATIAIVAEPSVAPMFDEITPAAQDEIVRLPDARTEASLLRAGRFDTAVLFPNSFRSAWVVRRAGIARRWGYSDGLRGWLLTSAVPKPRGRLHQAVYYLELVRRLGFAAAEATPRIEVTPETRRRSADLLQRVGVSPGTPIVGMAPGAAYGHAKRWPPSRVADVVARLHARGAVCVLVGAAPDREAGRALESSLPAGIQPVNLIGRTDLRLLIGLLASCHAFVSNDSGAMHLAAAVGVPVTAIFGPTDEQVTSPLGDHDILIHQVFCRPCMLRDCPIDHRCMKGITADVVTAAVTARLDASAAITPRAGQR
ncbi:MAG: lipopolysaccharide heptosyltransferase II [Acidobacteria bacterium]|nr:lipopolysaccharide heptosyltransferase II [Acidobacteriota bacterium]